MDHLETLSENRARLEDFLSDIDTDKKALELIAYDTMVKGVNDYHSRYNGSMNDLVDKIVKHGDGYRAAAVAEVQSIIETFGHRPAYIFVLNFDPDDPEHSERIFKPNRDRISVGKKLDDRTIAEDIQKIAYEDGAIIVDQDGRINSTNAQLVNVNPAEIPYIDGKDPYETIGFKLPVNTRHFSAIGASYHMPSCVVYVLGEHGHIRRFDEGELSFSTVRYEALNRPKPHGASMRLSLR